MLVNFWSSSAISSEFEVSFSYRHSELYAKGLNQRTKVDFSVYPLRSLELSNLAIFPRWFPFLLKRCLMLALRWLLVVPVMIYEVLVLRRLFMKVQPHVIHINNGGYPAALSARSAAIAAKLAGKTNVVMVVNNFAVGYSRPNRWLGYLVDRMVVRSVSKFVTGSKAATFQLKKVLRLNDAKGIAIHNGIALRQITETCEETLNRFGLGRFDGIIFGIVAILRPNKGHQVLLEAMARLAEKAPDVLSNAKLLIEGDGPLRQSLQAYVARHQLSNHCVFVGNEKNIMNFISSIDVLILPSVGEEDFPNVILEAMGLGKPVIASRIAGIPEQIVDGETGILVEARDVDELAEAIVRLGCDKKLRFEMGRAGFCRFQEHFRAEVAVNNYLTLYQSLVGAEQS